MKKNVEEKIDELIKKYNLTLERDKESTGATSPAKSSAETKEGAPSAQLAAKKSENVVAKSAQKAGATPGESR